ncbi:sugar kinase [Pinibacter soli]|uniref:Sugar kinase n=1 Tax=Pinibacter soli TaxID=3044211 RepID=A0ABT6RH28_9BACT|nr:sugar kinase [Pinibacter soli]MDI3321675.1 sugar kinase [Pinibacter soli]
MKKGKVLSFGEILLRICPDTNGEWLQDNSLPFYVGGAEGNVATALALWDVPSAYMSAMPDNMMAKQIAAYLESNRVDVSKMLYNGERIGLYYLPKGKDLKNAGVIYDRNYSSFSNLKTGTIDWDEVLKDVSWFNFSAISPALNQNVADVCKEAAEAASRKNITVSIDLNYRAKLWQYGKQPHDVVPELVKYCNVVMGNIWAAEKMLGIPVDASIINENSTKEHYLLQAENTSKAILQQFDKVKTVANTFRFDHAEQGINYYTALFNDNKLFVSHEYFAKKIVDKVGSGDCFMGGIIYGLYNELSSQETLEFATAAAYQKLFIESDATKMSAEEIKDKLKIEKSL